MYPTDRCHICNSYLIFDENDKCYSCAEDEDHYTIWDDNTISIKIDNYIFEFYNKNNNKSTKVWNNEITPHVYEADCHFYVNKKNYLKVLDKIKKCRCLNETKNSIRLAFRIP